MKSLKRILPLILIALFVTGTTGNIPFYAADTVSGIASFTVLGDERIVKESETRNKQSIEALEKLLNEAKKPVEKPSNPEEIAVIGVSYTSGATSKFSIYMDASGMYIYTNKKYSSISSDAFHKLLNVFGNNLYKYRTHPGLKLKSGETESASLYVSETNYSYLKLDKKYYKPYFEQSEPDIKLDPGEEWPSVIYNPVPVSATVSVYSDAKEPLFTGTWTQAGEYMKKNGQNARRIDIKAEYKEKDSLYRGSCTFTIPVERQKTAETSGDFVLDRLVTAPGELAVIRINNYKNGEKITFNSDISFTPKFFDDGNGGMISLLPISYFTGVGDHYINLSCGDRSVKWSVKVTDKKFQIQNLDVDSGTTSSTIESQKANDEYEKAIAPIRMVSDNKKYWDSFVWPVTGPRSTEFGMIRYVNGSPTSSRHGAIDFAVPRGTSVKATANGRVLYAGLLQLTGNTVVIEHGYGLKSWYYHMDGLNVKTGDTVKKSQQIGIVGSTGFSTGPHLHFGMSVNNVFINPDTVIDTEILQ